MQNIHMFYNPEICFTRILESRDATTQKSPIYSQLRAGYMHRSITLKVSSHEQLLENISKLLACGTFEAMFFSTFPLLIKFSTFDTIDQLLFIPQHSL